MRRQHDASDSGEPKKTGLAHRQVNPELADAGEGRQRLNFKMGEAKVFARNLRLLTEMRDLSPATASRQLREHLIADAEARLKIAVTEDKKRKAEAELALAQQADIQPKWYRRLMTKGVTKSHRMTRMQFHGLANWLGIPYEDMWRKDLVTFCLTDDLAKPHEGEPKEKSSWIIRHTRHLRMLSVLLDDDDCQFLGPLIDRLYNLSLGAELPLEYVGKRGSKVTRKKTDELNKERSGRKQK